MPSSASVLDPRVAIVIATRNRSASLLDTLRHLVDGSGQAQIVVVDNGSTDDSPAAVRTAFPTICVVELGENRGAAGRTVGVAAVNTPYVAFSDDDSWWMPGALAHAADLLDGNSRLGLIAGSVVLGDDARLDPACLEMARSPLPARRSLPGRPVLGFIACGAVVRREAYLAVCGFEPHFGVGGEEELLALDLAGAGWDLAYVPAVIARHYPSAMRDPTQRNRVIVRNALWSAWLRRPFHRALRNTAAAARAAWHDPAHRAGVAEALRGLPWVARARRPIPSTVE
ncbi:MAG: hypothetical protein QOF51_3858, partial [Chloroflexota bacterium]|nr:hypothetical protein [Chloroflexota bacterium]